jgi:type IV secretory pathway TrbD component
MLQVQWLEHGMLVHALTLPSPPAQPHTHALLGGAVSTGLGAVVTFALAQWLAAGLLALLWAVFAGMLSRAAWRARQAAQDTRPAPRRVLVELTGTEIAWSLLRGDRFGMTHDRRVGVALLEGADPVETPDGHVVRVRMAGGSCQDIPLHGLPRGDAEWLAQRIGEAIAAAGEGELD